MKAKLLGFAILGMILLGCQQNVWKEFRSPEGQFSLLMPGIPEKGMDRVNTPIGALEGHTFSVEQNEVRYRVGYADYPENLNQKPDSTHILNSIRLGVKGTLLNERTFSLDQHPGRQLLVESSDGYVKQIRVLLVDKRLYQLEMMAKLERASAKDTQKFFNSFQLQ